MKNTLKITILTLALAAGSIRSGWGTETSNPVRLLKALDNRAWLDSTQRSALQNLIKDANAGREIVISKDLLAQLLNENKNRAYASSNKTPSKKEIEDYLNTLKSTILIRLPHQTPQVPPSVATHPCYKKPVTSSYKTKKSSSLPLASPSRQKPIF